MTAVEVLKAARAKIKRGWMQGGSRKDGSAYCAMGAIGASSSNVRVRARARRVFIRVLPRPLSVTPIVDWNDAPGRTQAQVLAAFDKAISLAKADGP